MNQTIGLIAACDTNGIIGYDGGIPWFNKIDLSRFKKQTKDSSLIMGRKTFESLPVGKKSGKKLAGRLKIVLSHSLGHENEEDVFWTNDIQDAVDSCDQDKDIWFIGGRAIYEMAMAMKLVDVIDLTVYNINAFKQDMDVSKLVYFPNVPYSYKVDFEVQNEEDSLLWHRKYVKR